MSKLKLKLKNYKAFQNVELDVEKKINWVFAKNNQGKTSVSDSIKHVMTGLIPEEYIRKGEKEVSIELALGDLKLSASRAKTTKLMINDNPMTKEQFVKITEERLGINYNVLSEIVNIDKFFSKNNKEQTESIINLCGTHISFEEIIKKLEQYGGEKGLKDIDYKNLTPIVSIKSAKDILLLRDLIYNNRTELKRRLKALGDVSSNLIRPQPFEFCSKTYMPNEVDLKSIEDEMSKATKGYSSSAEVNDLEARIKKGNKYVDEVVKNMKAISSSRCPFGIECEKIKEIGGKLTQYAEDRDKYQKRLNELLAKKKEMDAQQENKLTGLVSKFKEFGSYINMSRIADNKQKESKDLETRIYGLNCILDVFDEKIVPSLIGENISGLEKHIRSTLANLGFPHGISLISSEGKLEFNLGVEYSLLSKSERLRIEVAFKHALATFVKFPLLIVDEIDLLDVQNRNGFALFINKIIDEYEAVILLCTINSNVNPGESALNQMKNTNVFVIEDGKIERLADGIREH